MWSADVSLNISTSSSKENIEHIYFIVLPTPSCSLELSPNEKIIISQVKKIKKYQEQFLEIQTKVASQKQPVVQHDGVGVSPPTNILLLHKKKNTLLLTF